MSTYERYWDLTEEQRAELTTFLEKAMGVDVVADALGERPVGKARALVLAPGMPPTIERDPPPAAEEF